MNRVYRLIWSESQTAYVPVPEFARRRGKGAAVRALSAAVVAALAFHAHALPTGGEVSAGQGGIAQSGGSMTVQQQSQNLAINWQSFGIGASESVNFAQPNASAIALNRVLGADPSQIHGRLTANGQIWLLNPNGVLFGGGAQVNVGGLVASTLNISDADFLAGKRTFGGSGGVVVNRGSITAAEGGYVALLGGRVSNEGVIQARLGTVALGAGNRITLDFAGDKLLSLQVDQGAVEALVQNKQLIQADGGTVLMSARAADALVAAVVNNSGIVEARTVENRSGVIKLLGDMEASITQVDGTLDASAPDGGDGGFIETSGQQLKIADGAVITTAAPAGQVGQWLIDPRDFNIAASGGDITGAALGTALGSNSVTIQTTAGNASCTNASCGTGTGANGDINVDDAVAWNAPTKLTLNAWRNININQSISAGDGQGKLALLYGQSEVASGNTATYNINAPVNLHAGMNFVTQLGSDGAFVNYTVITRLGAEGSTTGTDLQGMQGNLGRNYALGADIDASSTSGWNGGAGFAPLVYDVNGLAFASIFDGLGHTISGLTVNRPSTDLVGFFGRNDGSIRNVGLVDGAVNGNRSVGGLVGNNYYGTISNSYSAGAVSGNNYFVGGLVGRNDNGTISNSYSSGVVTGAYDSYAVGGLVGNNVYGNISNSYFSGTVGGNYYNVGGLVGNNYYGTISNSYSTGAVGGSNYVGGLVGYNLGAVSNSYSTSAVTGNYSVGGLVGLNNAGTISNSYSSGAVGGNDYVGGLVGINNNYGTISNSYWDVQTSRRLIGIGTGNPAGATGLTTAQMMQAASFTGFDFTNTWLIYDGHTYPLLKSFLKPLTVTADNVSKNYDGQTWSGGLVNARYSDPAASGSGHLYGLGAPYGDAVNVGSYSPDLWSDQQGYDISYVNGILTIDPAILNTINLSGTRAYDGTANVAANIFTLGGLVNGEDLSLAGVGTVADPNVGTNKPVSLGTLALGDGSNGLASNYTLSGGTHVATITPYVVDLAGSRAYDGTRDVAAGVFTLGSLVGNETLTLDGIGTLADKHVGVDKVVALGSLALGNGSNGGLAGNYTLEGGTRTATITQAPLTIAAVGDAKTYDGTTGSTATPSVTGLMNGDGVSGASQAFASKNVLGTDGSTLNVTAYTLDDGNHGGNYAVSTPTASGTITPAALTVSTSDVIKPYDGTTSAAGTAVATSGTQLFDTDTLSGGSFAFTDQNAGTNKTVTVGGVTVNDGNGGDNYVVSYANNTTSTIDPKALNANIVGNPTKVYDGTTLAKLTPGNYSLDGVVGGESVTLGDTSPKGSYNSQNVSEANTVTASLAGATFTAGADTLLSNYLLPTSASGAGQITPATLTYVADKTKLTQGSTIPTLTGLVTGFVNNETLGFATTGTALWTTTATPTSLIGNYAINGDGLTAHYGNYIFVQDAGNAKALTIKKP